MTATVACDKIEEAINALHVETRESGWDWCVGDLQSDASHHADHAKTLEKTRTHFDLPAETSMWFVSTAIPEDSAILAMCGNSPTAEARARYISWCNPQNMQLLIARIRELEGVAK